MTAARFFSWIPYEMHNNLQQIAKRTANAPGFQCLVILTILLVGVLAGIETDEAMVASFGPVLQRLNAIALGIFVIEACIKLAAHLPRPWDYFRDGWNVFDFTVIVLCLLPMNSQFAMVLRLGRTFRLLRLVSALPKLQLLVGALIKSLSSMGYVSLLLGLIFYIYAILGVHLFGAGDPFHFGSLSRALFTLFQTITLDDWKDLFLNAKGTSPAIAAAYFVSFILLGTMIMLNLFIGIIMNSMSEMHAELDAHEHTKRNLKGEQDVLTDVVALDQQLTSMKLQIKDLRAKLTRDIH